MTNRDIVLTHGKIYVKNEYTGDYNQNDEGKFTAMFMRCDEGTNFIFIQTLINILDLENRNILLIFVL